MPEDLSEDIEANFSLDRLMELAPKAKSAAEVEALRVLWNEAKDAELAAAIDDFRSGSLKFLGLLTTMTGHIDKVRQQSGLGTPALDAALADFSEIQRRFHDEEGMRKTHADADEAAEIVRDEKTIPPSASPAPLPPPPSGGPVSAPTPLNSRKFEALADEYVKYFVGAEIAPPRQPAVQKFADTATANKGRYEAVGDPLGIPWWFIAGIHLLESTYNFTTHLHNGDKLSARTFRVPAGRPVRGTPPFTWEESATDALKLQELNGLRDWSLPRALWRWERYNGFGYRKKGIATPYLWSFSSVYRSGKFVGDGVFDASAVSAQCGAAVLLKALHASGKVDIGIDVAAEDESARPDSDADAAAVVAAAQPNIDGEVPDQHPFQTFFAQSLPDIDHFEWHEFLVKGGSHAENGLNTDPPRELWNNIVPVARALDAFRDEVGNPVVLTSVYRSPEYNASVPGSATRSQHMAFTAADFKVVGDGAGTTGDWAARMKALRQAGVFEGGIGIYKTFVHIDARGTRADWDKR